MKRANFHGIKIFGFNGLPDKRAMKGFRSPPLWVKVVSLVLLFGLAGFSIFGAWKAYTMPERVRGSVPLASYQHKGEFDYLVYVNPSHLHGTAVETPKEETDSIYFTNLISRIDIEFNYDFIADGLITDVSNTIDLVAIVTGPSEWQKEVLLRSMTATNEHVTIKFPLRLQQFDQLIDEIEAELGIRSTGGGSNVYDLDIEGRVHIEGNTSNGAISDTFVLPMELKVGRGTLKWSNNLARSERKSVGGFSYKHQGGFGYTIKLRDNSLYESDTTVLNREPYEWPSALAIGPGDVYFSRITDVMMANFTYQFLCDKPVNKLTEEVEIKAVLEFPEVWSRTFVLVPKTKKSGDFTVDFAIDLAYFSELTSTIQDEIDLGPPTHDLTITAVVHTIAETDFGTINEVFTHMLEGTLTATAITWNYELAGSEPGSIMGAQMVPNTERFIGFTPDKSRIIFPIAAAVFLLAAVYWLAVVMRYREPWLSDLEKEAILAKKKHKGLIVDVVELPDIKGGMVVSLNTLAELVTTADTLFKPVLHKAGRLRHIYRVIDAAVVYEYVNDYGIDIADAGSLDKLDTGGSESPEG